MANNYLILDGDTTSHGGNVIVNDKRMTISGEKVACIGDDVYCPHCKGIYPIIAGAERVHYRGLNVAVEGNTTSCGAVLLASQQLVSIK